MKGDFSRIRFNPSKQYTSVLKQQGRVDLDSDANEQKAINETLRATINTDVIGKYGGPEDDAGFKISIVGDSIEIGPGRYYVDGMLAENPHLMRYDEQPYLLDATDTAGELLQKLARAEGKGTLQFVLEVWQRLVTALDDPCLLEPALGQADTTARLQTVWRVVGTVIENPNTPGQPLTGTSANAITHLDLKYITARKPDQAQQSAISQLSPCCQLLYGAQQTESHSGEMGALLDDSGSDCGCQPIAAAGYQGLENQLYRVEIHQGGDLTSATFKWSRENGSVVAKVTQVGINSPVITVNSLGPDANLGFQAGQWVELSDDTYLFGETPNQPGLLFQIASVTPATMQVTMTAPVFGIDTAKNARMRRWDQFGASATASGIAISNTPIPLENGIEVNFSKGQFFPGDYWTIPARTANGQIDWPPCGSSGRHFQPSSYAVVHRAPLACALLRFYFREQQLLQKTGQRISSSPYLVNDCRLLFPPLTALSASAATPALHITATSWVNDDIVTIDSLLQNGLSVTFDQATTCPWGGGNFQVHLEPPFGIGAGLAVLEGNEGIPKPTFTEPPGTDSFIRTVIALDPPWGITVSGNTVSWINSVTGVNAKRNYGAWEVLGLLNALLTWQNPTGYARVRIRLIASAVYGSGDNGNIYLDGLSFGKTGIRSLDGSQSVNQELPSGESQAVSDYEGWFYLAPTLFISSLVIQGLTGTNVTKSPLTALKILVDYNNNITGYQIGETAAITSIQAEITLSYPPVADTVVSLLFTGTGAGSVATVASSVTIPAGQKTFTTAINIVSNPGAVTDTVTLIASVPTAVNTLSVNNPPTLAITGMTAPARPVP